MSEAPVHRTPRSERFAARFHDRWRIWALLTAAALVVAFFVVSVTSWALAVRRTNAVGNELKADATAALPAGARVTTPAFLSNGKLSALIFAAASTPPATLLNSPRPLRGRLHWAEVPGTRTATTRDFISASQARLLTLTVHPCTPADPGCPTGGSFIEIEVFVGGPNAS